MAIIFSNPQQQTQQPLTAQQILAAQQALQQQKTQAQQVLTFTPTQMRASSFLQGVQQRQIAEAQRKEELTKVTKQLEHPEEYAQQLQAQQDAWTQQQPQKNNILRAPRLNFGFITFATNSQTRTRKKRRRR